MTRSFYFGVAFVVLAGPAMAQGVSPSGVLSVDCAQEIRRYCREANNPSSHRPCLETQVKDVGALCRASMEKNGVRRR